MAQGSGSSVCLVLCLRELGSDSERLGRLPFPGHLNGDTLHTPSSPLPPGSLGWGGPGRTCALDVVVRDALPVLHEGLQQVNAGLALQRGQTHNLGGGHKGQGAPARMGTDILSVRFMLGLLMRRHPAPWLSKGGITHFLQDTLSSCQGSPDRHFSQDTPPSWKCCFLAVCHNPVLSLSWRC